jgi:hypothetical protein
MKKLALILALMGTQVTAEKSQMMEHCTLVSIYAEMAMKSRQTGVPLVDALEGAEAMKAAAQYDYSTAMADMMTEFILKAYERPRFGTKGVQQKYITDFSSDAMLGCIQAWRDRE